MIDNKSYRELGLAVFLAAIMVLSTVAMSAVLAGGVAAQQQALDGERTVEDTVLNPGESTNVTVTVSLDEQQSIELVDSFSPEFADVSVNEDASGPGFTGANSAEAFLNADSDQATLVYEVTVPEDAAGETFEISSDTEQGNVDAGTDVISVTDPDALTGDRTVENSQVAPGGSTNVTLTVSLDEQESIELVDSFSPEFADVSVNEDASGPGFTGANSAEAFLNADSDQATLVYEVTVPDDSLGETFTISSDTDQGNVDAGTDTIDVVQDPEPDMSVDFGQQGVGAQGQDTIVPAVYATNVDSDGEEAALVVTYQNDTTGDLVIAGLTTGTYDGETVQVQLGTSDAALGGFPGNHTVHIIPTDGLSGQYAPGDTVSAETAGNVIDNEQAPVYNWNIILSDQEFSESTSEITLDLGLLTDGMGNDTLYTVDLHPTDNQGNLIGSEYTGSTDVLSGESQDVTVDLQNSTGDQITLEPGDEVEYIPMIHVVDDPSAEEGDPAVPGTYPALTTSFNNQVLPAINQSATISVVECVEVVEGECATDTTGDGLLNDVNGDDEFTIVDVQVFFDERESSAVQDNPELFNFDGGEPADVTVSDVQALFQLFQNQ
jgi:surface glycoprotein (TIGR04207 family)